MVYSWIPLTNALQKTTIHCNTLQWGSWRIFSDAFVTTAQWKRARDLTNLGYPQVPGSIPAETPSTHMIMDLSKKTLKQGF